MIGIFDSGIGGLTVVREFLNQLPEYNILYFGDTARTPYGTKSKDTIIKYAMEDARILLERGAKVIVIACNSASSAAYEKLKKEFPEVPIFEVVAPAVGKAAAITGNSRIGLVGTSATVRSGIYEKLLKEVNPKIKLFSRACPLLVPLAEEGWLEASETKRIIKKYLAPLKVKQIDTLILGCTHYPLFKKNIRIKIGKRVNLVDSAVEVVSQFKIFLKNNPTIKKSLESEGQNHFFVSDINDKFTDISQKWLGRKIKLEKVEVK